MNVQDISGDFLPSNININNFIGILTCYFKGYIDSDYYNCKFNSTHFNNVTINGFILGNIDGKCNIINIIKTSVIPDEYLNGDHDVYE